MKFRKILSVPHTVRMRGGVLGRSRHYIAKRDYRRQCSPSPLKACLFPGGRASCSACSSVHVKCGGRDGGVRTPGFSQVFAYKPETDMTESLSTTRPTQA